MRSRPRGTSSAITASSAAPGDAHLCQPDEDHRRGPRRRLRRLHRHAGLERDAAGRHSHRDRRHHGPDRERGPYRPRGRAFPGRGAGAGLRADRLLCGGGGPGGGRRARHRERPQPDGASSWRSRWGRTWRSTPERRRRGAGKGAHAAAMGVDLVCEMSGHPSGHAQAFAAARLGGRINMLGTPSRSTEVELRAGRDLQGAHHLRGDRPPHVPNLGRDAALPAVGELDPQPVVTHRFPLEQIADAIAVIKGGEAGKVISGDRPRDARQRPRRAHSTPHARAVHGQDGVYKRSTTSQPAGRARRDGGPRRGHHPLVATTTSGSATSRRWWRRARRRSTGTAPAPRRCASSAGPSRCTGNSRWRCARLVGTEASLSFVSCWNANEAVPARCSPSTTSSSPTSSTTPRSSTASGSPRRSPSARPGVQARRPRRPGAPSWPPPPTARSRW